MSALRRRQLGGDVIVTFRAQRTLIADERSLERTRVRSVAGQAFAAFERIVNVSAGISVHQIAVTFGAEIRASRVQEVALVRSVAVMAGDAVAPSHRRVYELL